MPASLFDSNIWVALTFKRHPFHLASKEALRQCSIHSPAAFCRSTEQSFLRLASSPAVLAHYESGGLTNGDAIRFLRQFHQSDRITFVVEPDSTRDRWLALGNSPFASPKLWMDAYLAAFAISGNLRFVTADHDFRQFESAGLDLLLITP